MSEVFLYLMPDNSDFNVSLLWLICAIFFILQVNTPKLSPWIKLQSLEK